MILLPTNLSGMEGGDVMQAPVVLPRRPYNFGEEDDEEELGVNSDDPEDDAMDEMACQHDEAMTVVWQEDACLKARAEVAVQEAKQRKAAGPEEDPPDFIKAKKKGEGANATWYEGPREGMVFKTGTEGLGCYREAVLQGISLTEELMPMAGCDSGSTS